MIKAVGVVKKIGGRIVLKGIDLELAAGEFTAVMGPNGAGKTTLLKILSLLDKPTSGEISINGVVAADQPAALRRQIGVISHHTMLYGNLTAEENLRFYGRMYDVPGLAARIKEVIAGVGLEYALTDPVRTYSRGMQQRLAIARAILHDPAVLFLDEPYTGLDHYAIGILNRILGELKARGKTIFLITHNFDQGLDLSDRLLILAKGRIVYQAATAEAGGGDFQQVYLRYVEGT